MNNIARVCFLSAVFLLTACAQQQAVDSALPSDDFFRELVAERYVKPFKAGDIEQWLEAFDDNANAMHNRRPMDRGKQSIEAFGLAVKEYFTLEQFDVVVTDIRKSPDWAYTIGEFTSEFVNKSDGSRPFGVEQGKFLLVWARQADGSWKIILDSGNSNQ